MDAIYMLYAEALKFEKSRNALHQKLRQAPYWLNPSTLECLAPDVIKPVRLKARCAYMNGLLTYLKQRCEEAILSADDQAAIHIYKCIADASWDFFPKVAVP